MIMASLLQRCRAGDPAAIQSFVREHERQVYRLALSILNDPHEADEATQDAFLAALRSLDGYRGEAAPSTWLYAITVNVCRMRLRKRRGWERLVEQVKAWALGEAASPPRIEEAVLQNERDRRLWEAVQALGEKHRLPVLLFYYHDLPVKEIALMLEIREGTVLSRLATARGRLRRALESE